MIVSSAAVSFGFGKALELLTHSQIDKAGKVRSDWALSPISRLTRFIGCLCRTAALHRDQYAYEMHRRAPAGTYRLHQKSSICLLRCPRHLLCMGSWIIPGGGYPMHTARPLGHCWK